MPNMIEMSSLKIIVDTNVMISASIFHHNVELGIIIKDEFYDKSISSFKLFEEYASEKIGYLAPQVKFELSDVLYKAVENIVSLINIKLNDNLDYKYTVYKVYLTRMKEILKLLIEEELDETQIQRNLINVQEIPAFLKNELKAKYSQEVWCKQQAYARSTLDDNASQAQRDEAF